MNVFGIDLAAEPAKTGVVLLAFTEGRRWQARSNLGRATDDELVGMARSVDVIGVDSPLGWPTAFVEAVGTHAAFRPWPGAADRSELTHRETDREVKRLTAKVSLSVSADKLGSVAMRCALLQRRWAEEVWKVAAPRDGTGPLVETYPAAAFARWAIDATGYKPPRKTPQAAAVRGLIVDTIGDATASWLDIALVRTGCIESDHTLDALVSAIVCLAAKCSGTHVPSGDQRPYALSEGWIHVPTTPLSDFDPRSSLLSRRVPSEKQAGESGVSS